MIQYFKTNDFKDATNLYVDLVHSLANNPARLKEASKQFGEVTHPSFQLLILQLAKIDGLEFNVYGLIVTVTKFSVNYRFKLSAIRVPGYTKRWNEDKVQWSFIPINKVGISLDMITNSLNKLNGIQYTRNGTWIWISGNTYKVKEDIKKAVRGTFCQLGFKKATKQWYVCPKYD